jgi:hypothetical protein
MFACNVLALLIESNPAFKKAYSATAMYLLVALTGRFAHVYAGSMFMPNQPCLVLCHRHSQG